MGKRNCSLNFTNHLNQVRVYENIFSDQNNYPKKWASGGGEKW